MYDLEYLPVAREDIREITEYISNKLNNPEAAEKLVIALVEKAESLKQMPYLNPVYIPIKHLGFEYRKVRVKNYLIFYWVDELARKIVIARVIYSKRDFDQQFSDEKYEFEKKVDLKLQEATDQLMYELEKGRVSGEKNGRFTSEEVRRYFSNKKK